LQQSLIAAKAYCSIGLLQQSHMKASKASKALANIIG